MLLPMFGLVLVLIVAGAVASIVAIADPQHARRATFLGFPSLLAGTGALLLSVVLSGVGHAVDQSTGLQVLSGLGFFFGYVTGGVGGAVAGFALAVRRVRSRRQ
ncbi:MAG TPA: hypothetical protein VGO96_14835 [Pyrinomonadaceae bacterium]|jgi:hypothetical protein|nr:hypothetical protein [Pyrinomonadaceae bacterium]